MDDNISIGLLVIATKKYINFIPPLFESADKFFLKNKNVTYFLFTDHEGPVVGPRPCVQFNVPHKPWPWMTLERYKIFTQHQDDLKKMDFLYYCDADMLFAGEVGDEILGDRVATDHPGCLLFNPRGNPESNPESTACIGEDEEIPGIYKCGGFNGGSSEEFLKMSNTLSHNIDKDLEKNIIAEWHDESHFNRYMIDHPPTLVLPPSYCFAQCYTSQLLEYGFTPKLIALDKNHDEIRREE